MKYLLGFVAGVVTGAWLVARALTAFAPDDDDPPTRARRAGGV